MPTYPAILGASNLSTIVEDFCRRQGLPVPATVVGSTNPQILQIKALLEEEGDDLAMRHSWEGLVNEASFTTVAAETQGPMYSLADNGFWYIKNGTIWDRSTRLPVCGPVDSQDWQALKAVTVTGPRYQWRIRQGRLLVNPTPPAGESWYFEYVSKWWIIASTGTSVKRRFTMDSDFVVFPDDIILMGLRWRWKKEKGFDYAEDFRSYEAAVKDAMGRDGGKPIIHMDGYTGGPAPGIYVPDGSWQVP
jgi:hypothetical protein